MSQDAAQASRIPSVDEVLRTAVGSAAVERFGRQATVASVRTVLDATRKAVRGGLRNDVAASDVAAEVLANLELQAKPNVRPVFNLTGTVLHTNLGRAILAEAAIEAAVVAMREALALEFDLTTGQRGERDALIRGLLCELTGAKTRPSSTTTPPRCCWCSTRSPRARKRSCRAAN